MGSKNNSLPKITGDILISDMVEAYPQVVDFLMTEYGFHCVSCFISGYEVLEDGAKVHGIEGEDFEQMLADINKVASGEISNPYDVLQ